MTFEAVYMPGDNGEDDPSKGGFATIEDAIRYAESNYCQHCKEELLKESGHVHCSGEWGVFEED